MIRQSVRVSTSFREVIWAALDGAAEPGERHDARARARETDVQWGIDGGPSPQQNKGTGYLEWGCVKLC